MSPEKAQEVGDATAAKIGRAKYGKTGNEKDAEERNEIGHRWQAQAQHLTKI